MTASASSPSRARLVGLGLLCVTFIVGAFSGAAFERTLGAREPVKPANSCASKLGPFHGPPGSLIIDRVDLSADQRQRINGILEKRRKEADALWQAQKPMLRSIVDSTREEIRTLLTPEQRAVYDRLREERRAQHKKDGCDNQKEKPAS
jgi:Spy/CpxP family protein refolding chaperone